MLAYSHSMNMEEYPIFIFMKIYGRLHKKLLTVIITRQWSWDDGQGGEGTLFLPIIII